MNIDRRTGIAPARGQPAARSRSISRGGSASDSASPPGSRTTATRSRSPSGASVPVAARPTSSRSALGTGVGGGIILDGRLYRGWAELGHIVVARGRAAVPGQLPRTGSPRGASPRARRRSGPHASSGARRPTRRRSSTSALEGDEPRRAPLDADRPLPRCRDRVAREHLRTRRRRRRRRLRRSPHGSSLREPALARPRGARRCSPRTRRSGSSRRSSGTMRGSSERASSAFEALDGER